MQDTFIGLLTLVIGVVLCFGGHRLLVIAVTAAAGAGAILAGVLVLVGKLAFDVPTATDPTAIVRSTPLWLLLLIVLFLAGVGAQWSIRSKAAPKPTPMAT